MATYNNQEEENKKQETTKSVEQSQKIVIGETVEQSSEIIEQNPKIKQANAKLQHNANEFIKSLSIQKKKRKKKKVKQKLVLPKSTSSIEFVKQPKTIPPAHCWQVHRVMMNGVWSTPLHPWACVDIQNGIIDPAAFAAANPGLIYPMQGPFIVANLAPVPVYGSGGNSTNPIPFGATVIGSTAWLNHLNSDQSYMAAVSGAFYDWVTNHPNNTNNLSMSPGDLVTVHELGPTYITGDTIDDSFPADPIEAFCLRYMGAHWVGGDSTALPDIQGYLSIFSLVDLTHNNSVAGPISDTDQCINIPPDYEPNPCGEIGSINPETGGMIFAVEQGPNQDVYYEVAPSNVLIARDDNGNTISLPMGETPIGALGTDNCGYSYDEEITLLNSTSEDQTQYGTLVPAPSPSWTNLLMHGNIFACGSIVPPVPPNFGCFPLYTKGGGNYPVNNVTYQAYGIGPGSDNPAITSANYTNHVDVGTKVYFFDENGDPCFMYGSSTGGTARDVFIPNGYNVVVSTYVIPANTSGGTWHPFGGGTSYSTNMSNPMDVLVITMEPDPSTNAFLAANGHSITGGLLPYCTANPAPGHVINSGFDSTPTGQMPVWSTKFVNTIVPPSSGGPFTLLGLEWGVYNRVVSPTTSARFSGIASSNAIGYKNTTIIDNYTQFPSPPFGHPTLPTRHVAAEETLKYDVQQITSFPFTNAGGMQQIPLAEGEGWYLPSLDEFLEMINTVGPDSNVWNNPLYNTLEHDDFFFRWTHDENGNHIQTDNQVYWTSSEDDADSNTNPTGISSYIGSDPEKFGVAVHLTPQFGNTFHPNPLFTARCHPLIARPIRKFVCDSISRTPEYNYRDSHNIWVEGDGQQGAGGGGQQSLTPFVSVYSPGGAASGGGSNTANVGGNPMFDDDIHCSTSVIGKEYFSWGVSMTDAMGNEYDEDAFTNINQQDDPTGTNPNGFIISIWDNQKQFLGRWHYQFSKHTGIRQSALNWNGYTRDCANHPNPNPGVNCYDDPVNGQNMPYQVVEADFPAMIGLEMWGVTHLEGPHPVFRYGGNREEAARRRWRQPATTGTVCDEQNIPFSDWHHPYMENTFNGFTASYAYIKLEAAEMANQAANPANMYNPIDGPNTDIDSMEVVCLRNLFLDTYQGFSPPNEDLAPYVGSLLGCGDISNHWWNDQNSQGGGYGWQFANPTRKGNSAFGDLYGINYVDGRLHDPNFQPFPFMNQGIGPNLALHPKHWAFIWHAAYKPNSGAVNWYKDLHDGYNSCYGYRCHWNLGDTGPAGGIIVGVPNMTGWESVPGGASTNDSNWYYEMSPVDLDNGSDWPVTEYGMWDSWVTRANVPASADSNIQTGYASMNSLCPGIVDMGGNINSEFVIEINPYTITGNGIGEKREFTGMSGATTDIFPCSQIGMGGSVTGPPFPPIATNNIGAENAFHLCANYETQDIFGHVYNDWYLPNIQESWYIMNNAPVGTFQTDPNERNNLYWTSNQYDENEHINGDGEIIGDINGWEQLTRNTMYEAGSTGFNQGQPNPTFTRERYAYAYNVAEKVIKQGPITLPTNPPPPPPILNWQPLSGNTKATYVISKDSNLKVRAIRRFRCPDLGADPGSWGT